MSQTIDVHFMYCPNCKKEQPTHWTGGGDEEAVWYEVTCAVCGELLDED